MPDARVGDPACPVVGVVGATGAVGREALAILSGRGHPPGRVVALASARSAGQRVPFGGGEVVVRAVDDDALASCDVVLCCASAEVARRYAPPAVEAGAVVIDNSSAFRAEPGVPLVVPEVNPGALGDARLIANPNCSTILLLTALSPLRRRFGVGRIVVSTYQAVSGAGLEAVEELRVQSLDVLHGRGAMPGVFHEPCAFNVFSHESAVDAATGLNGEEAKMLAESRRVWDEPGLELIPTCVRVPVERAHTQSVLVWLEDPVASEADVLGALEGAPGVEVVEDRAGNRFPTPLGATGDDGVLVGRVRRFGAGVFGLLLSGDQLRKGAALNAVQLMDLALQRRAGVGVGTGAGLADIGR